MFRSTGQTLLDCMGFVRNEPSSHSLPDTTLDPSDPLVSSLRTSETLPMIQSALDATQAKPPRFALVLVGDYIAVYGMRKLTTAAQRIIPETRAFYVSTGGRLHSIKNILFSKKNQKSHLCDADLPEVAAGLKDVELIGFSSMTIDSDWTKKLIAEVRKVNPNATIIWGGMHSIVRPEDAIEHADIVCTGEGDLALDELLTKMEAGEDYTDVENFWFRKADGEIVRNGHRALMKPEEMELRPHPAYADESETIFERGKGFVPISLGTYLDFNGLSYHTLWTQGCPYRCTYCGNTAFLAIDKKYASIRQPSIDYIIDEVKQAVAKHPHINTVVFDDDCMAALPLPILKEFGQRWKKEVGIPFFVAGIIPSYVKREKLEILLDAGMNRLRMGIQSGSNRMLKFFKRPNKPGLLLNAASVIGDYRKYMIPPAYDMIVDIPVEEQEDLQQTLQLIYDMPRPFTLNVFSLRNIPGTVLEDQLQKLKDENHPGVDDIDMNYHTISPTMANVCLFLIATIRPPKRVFKWMLANAHPSHEKPKLYPFLLWAARMMFFTKRGLNDLRFMDFSVLPGKFGYFMWKIRFWQKHFCRHFHLGDDNIIAEKEEMNLPVPHTYSSLADAGSAKGS